MDSLKNAGPACPTTKVGEEEGEIGSCRGSYEEPSRTSEILFAAFEKGGMRQALKDLTIEHAINLYQIIDIWNDGSLGIHVSSQTDFMAFYASLQGITTEEQCIAKKQAAAAKWA